MILLGGVWHDFFFRYCGRWNTILVILIGGSIFALAIFLERLACLRKSEIDTGKFIIELRRHILSHNIIEAIRFCEDTGGTISTIVRSGLVRHQKEKGEIESSMELAGRVQIAYLERNVKILSLVAHIAPLIGLLGTVVGFIAAFGEMRKAGLMDISASRIGEAMEYALVTTAAGLLLAIPAFIAYNYLVSRIKELVLEMETCAAEILDLLTSNYEI